jgi:hypothetical protein
MKTTKKPTAVLLSEDEQRAVKQQAAGENLSVSNFIRVKLGLKPLPVGAPIGNKFALKKKAPAASKKKSSKKRSIKAAK